VTSKDKVSSNMESNPQEQAPLSVSKKSVMRNITCTIQEQFIDSDEALSEAHINPIAAEGTTKVENMNPNATG
jgi:hypothetical protein